LRQHINWATAIRFIGLRNLNVLYNPNSELTPNGNYPTLFIDYEREALQGAREIYHSPSSKTFRNEISIFTTAYSCSHDIVDLSCKLADVSNIQETVKNGLIRKTAEEDRQVRVRHGEDVYKFYQTYQS
jgi:hypothetical protein